MLQTLSIEEIAPEREMPQKINIVEVVREPRMKFFKVPRLGAYLALKLNYQSCLFEEALDEAIKDKFEVRQRKKQQKDEMNEWLEEQNKIKEEKEKIEEEYNIEDKEWEKIKPKEFLSNP